MTTEFAISWARAKLDRAKYHYADFMRVDKQVGPNDKAGEELLALIFGDTVHNLRSALDAAVWEVLIAESGPPSNPNPVKFPICLKESAWDKAIEPMRGALPAEFVARMKRLQPFERSPGREERNPLVHLHNFDIDDKHRISVHARSQLEGFGLLPDPLRGNQVGLAVDFQTVIILRSGTPMSALQVIGPGAIGPVENALDHLQFGADLGRLVTPPSPA